MALKLPFSATRSPFFGAFLAILGLECLSFWDKRAGFWDTFSHFWRIPAGVPQQTEKTAESGLLDCGKCSGRCFTLLRSREAACGMQEVYKTTLERRVCKPLDCCGKVSLMFWMQLASNSDELLELERMKLPKDLRNALPSFVSKFQRKTSSLWNVERFCWMSGLRCNATPRESLMSLPQKNWERENRNTLPQTVLTCTLRQLR